MKIGRAIRAYYFDVWYNFFSTWGSTDKQFNLSVPDYATSKHSWHRIGNTFSINLTKELSFYVGTATILYGTNIWREVEFFGGLVFSY